MSNQWILKSSSTIILPFWIFVWKGSTTVHCPRWSFQKVWVNLNSGQCFLTNCFVILIVNNCFWCWTLRKVGCDSCLYVTCKVIFRKGYHVPWSVIDLGNFFNHILRSFQTTCWTPIIFLSLQGSLGLPYFRRSFIEHWSSSKCPNHLYTAVWPMA
jgi:hypothetical protein